MEILGTVTCPVGGHEVTAEMQISLVPPVDPPLGLRVGDRITPVRVAQLDQTLVRLRPRADPDAGAALLPWLCVPCRAERWALVGFDTVDGEGVVTFVEGVPMTAETLDRADWIDAAIVDELTRGTPAEGAVPFRGQLDPEQRQVLADALAQRSRA